MKFITSSLTLLLLLSACAEKDEQFCTCLDAGEALNVYSNDLLTETVETNNVSANKLNELKRAKKEACADYEMMSGVDMIERQKECAKD